ncbi:MAG: DUF721 domain-containing protein [Gammaproteobacteria bacterium]|nr:DUF721 domain-containing protein [Gammaproteobacteria bacterium]MDE0649739.1 DUF721 domain-containing protein [Gammaproteobacteria bacterium]
MSETREEIARILAGQSRAAGPGGKREGATEGVPGSSKPGVYRAEAAGSTPRGPEKVGDVLERVLRRRGLAREMAYQKLLEDWPRLVGAGLARVTRARSVRNGVLVVEVPSSAWAMELNLRRRQIMARLNAGRSVRIKRVMFVLSAGDDEAGGW